MSRKPIPVEQHKTYRPRDVDLNRPHHVYRLFAEDDTLLYIGCTEDVQSRIYMHTTTWTMVDAFLIHRHLHHHTSQEYPTKVAAREAERSAIKAERPLLNRQHNPTRWRRVRGQGYIPADAETAELHARLSAPPAPTAESIALMQALDRMFLRPTGT